MRLCNASMESCGDKVICYLTKGKSIVINNLRHASKSGITWFHPGVGPFFPYNLLFFISNYYKAVEQLIEIVADLTITLLALYSFISFLYFILHQHCNNLPLKSNHVQIACKCFSQTEIQIVVIVVIICIFL